MSGAGLVLVATMAARVLANDLGAQHRPARAVQQDTLAIEHVSVLPMDRDTLLADHTVLVARDRIVWVGPSRGTRVPRGARRVDGNGAYLLPGLADMHVHLRSVEELPLYVAAGVTTVRNMNGRPEHLAWRDRVAGGALAGPRIFTSGPAVSRRLFGLKGVGPRTVTEADRFVREQSGAGYDMIKVQNGIALPVYERLLQVAKLLRMPVVGHVVSGVGAERSLAAGQVSFEHAVIELFDGGQSRLDEGARAIARAGAWVGTVSSDRNGRCAPPTELDRRIIAALRRADVKLLAGADASLPPIQPGGGLHCELATLVAAGLSPYEALVTATRNAGEFARLHLKERVPFGTVTVGARADFVLLPADPRADIGALTRPRGTVLRGVWLPR
jgi:imidazolonepropionase-like amidohydrolase